jgi:hypothetical protein
MGQRSNGLGLRRRADAWRAAVGVVVVGKKINRDGYGVDSRTRHFIGINLIGG